MSGTPDLTTELERRGEELLGRLGGGDGDALPELDRLLLRLRDAIATDPPAGRVLGPLIGRLEGAGRRVRELQPLSWVDAGGGRIALGHRPSRTDLADLPLQGATHVITLLSESEGAGEVGRGVREAGMSWYWLPMPSARVPSSEEEPRYREALNDLEGLLAAGGSLYLHCSAGIHRTGMIAFALLRWLGHPSAEARRLLRALRDETGEGVGEERMAWGDRLTRSDPAD